MYDMDVNTCRPSGTGFDESQPCARFFKPHIVFMDAMLYAAGCARSRAAGSDRPKATVWESCSRRQEDLIFGAERVRA